MKFFLHIIANALALIISDLMIPGVNLDLELYLSDSMVIISLLGMSFVLFVINSVLRPILNILLFPFIILSLGVFSIIINLGLLQLFDWITPSFSIQGLWALILCSIVISMTNVVFSRINN